MDRMDMATCVCACVCVQAIPCRRQYPHRRSGSPARLHARYIVSRRTRAEVFEAIARVLQVKQRRSVAFVP